MGTKVDTVKLGFWYSEDEPKLPKPKAQARPYATQKEVETTLRFMQQHKNAKVLHYKGVSTCRICGVVNHSTEFKLELDGSLFVWPAGLLHYFTEHNVQLKPSLENRLLRIYDRFKLHKRAAAKPVESGVRIPEGTWNEILRYSRRPYSEDNMVKLRKLLLEVNKRD